MSERPALFLAIDHRRSFEQLFGLATPIDAATAARLRKAKTIAVEALASVAAERPGLGGVGVLLDDLYGTDATAVAARLGVAVAVAFERSGQEVLAFEHDDWRRRLHGLAAAGGDVFAKVLVRHRPDGDIDTNAVQRSRLVEIDAACREVGVPLLLEVLTPFRPAELAASSAEELEATLRPRLVVDAIADIQATGVRPALWKVEGVADIAACRAVVAQARSGDGADEVGIVVLGAGAPADTVNRWLRSAAAAGYTGFAVGRSIWADSLVAWLAGDVDADAARATIAARYLDFVDVFTS